MSQPTPQPTPKSSGWTDHEIYGLAQDRLKFDHYAGVLAEIIQEADTPLTLGVFGPWGSGKTSLMRLIKDTLDHSGDKTQFKTVWFDAWTFDKEEALWRALLLLVLRAVRKEIEDGDQKKKDKEAADKALKKLEDLEASLYRDVDRAEVGGVTIDWEKAVKGSVSGLMRLTLSLVPGVGTFLAKTAEEAQKELSGGTLDSLFDAVQRKRQEIHRDHVESLEKFKEGFRELLDDHFVDQHKRLVVFIDDLDRCLPEKAISVLEAIKLFIDAPGCVYVIGTDRDVIEQGIRVKYKDFFVGEATTTPITGDSYLEKIIQIPFHLPPLQEKRIEDFIAQYDESVPPDCAAIFAAGMQPNPRKVKRIINVFRLLRKLAEVRVAEKEIDQFTAGLLAKIVVIQSRWRELYNDLQEYPNLVQDLERKFRGEEVYREVKVTSLDNRGRAEEQKKIVRTSAAKRENPLPSGVDVEEVEPESMVEADPQQPTLLQKYVAIKPLGKMLSLPPYFEDLKIDQIQLYLYMTHTVEAEAEKQEEVFNVDQRRWDDLLSNDLTKVRAAAEAIQVDNQVKSYTPSLLNVILGKKEASTRQRVSVGNALAYLSDPRFHSRDHWCLRNEVLLGFVEIPSGTFWMGSDKKDDWLAENDELPAHKVSLPTYFMGLYPVTVAQFRVFVEDVGYQLDSESSLDGIDTHPVVNVTWHEALKYCGWLTRKLRSILPKDDPSLFWQGLRDNIFSVMLPSEAEWEKAARGTEKNQIYPWGDKFDKDNANTDKTIGRTSAVGSFPDGRSPYGILDLSGNVWEWTRSLWGRYDEPEFKYPYDDPQYKGREDLQAPPDVRRVLRGGSFSNRQEQARCAARGKSMSTRKAINRGFRVVVSQGYRF